MSLTIALIMVGLSVGSFIAGAVIATIYNKKIAAEIDRTEYKIAEQAARLEIAAETIKTAATDVIKEAK
jgi:uncharacterized membrane protein (DUF485 family)